MIPKHQNVDRNTVMAQVTMLGKVLQEETLPLELREKFESEKQQLLEKMDTYPETIMDSVIRSHKAICKAKNMEEKSAFGNDPAVYYSLGICSEAGELAKDIIRGLRNGWNKEELLNAVKGELPDVVIYSYVLAYVLDIDLTALVNAKVDIVVNRAENGYYGRAQ